MTYSKASGFIQRREDEGLEVVVGTTPHEPLKVTEKDAPSEASK